MIRAFRNLLAHQLNEDERIAAHCLQEHPKEWSAAAACIAQRKSSLPPAAKDAMSCAQTSGSDPKVFASCMAAKQLPDIPGDLGVPLVGQAD
jgi:hypothetical protein